MRYTKSDMVLALTENIYDQQDIALVERVQRGFGVDFMNEEEFTDDDLQSIVMNEGGFLHQLGQSFNPFHGAKTLVSNSPAVHSMPAATAAAPAAAATTGATGGTGLGHQAVQHATAGLTHVGTGVSSVAHGVGLHGAGNLATAHPVAAGAAVLGLGAAAALRMRSNMKARAQARAAGMR